MTPAFEIAKINATRLAFFASIFSPPDYNALNPAAAAKREIALARRSRAWATCFRADSGTRKTLYERAVNSSEIVVADASSPASNRCQTESIAVPRGVTHP